MPGFQIRTWLMGKFFWYSGNVQNSRLFALIRIMKCDLNVGHSEYRAAKRSTRLVSDGKRRKSENNTTSNYPAVRKSENPLYICYPCNLGTPLPGIRCLRSLDCSLIAKEKKIVRIFYFTSFNQYCHFSFFIYLFLIFIAIQQVSDLRTFGRKGNRTYIFLDFGNSDNYFWIPTSDTQ